MERATLCVLNDALLMELFYLVGMKYL